MRMDNIQDLTGGEVQTLLKNDVTIVHYILYFLLIDGTNEVLKILYNLLQNRRLDLLSILKNLRVYCAYLTGSIGVLLYSNHSFVGEDFFILFIVDMLIRFPKTTVSISFTYGVGLACSYIEGYLVHVIPSDGHKYVGFKKNVEKYEQSHGIVFPVKKMFIVINKAMYCPPDLKEFNKMNRRDLSTLEACQSLEEITKDVAGVKDRKYSNSVYCIKRPDRKTIFVVAGTSSPLNTLYNVLKNKHLFDVLSHINVAEVVEQYISTLQQIINNSPVYKDSCEIVFFDSEDEQQNLADILLKRISELESNYENIRGDY